MKTLNFFNFYLISLELEPDAQGRKNESRGQKSESRHVHSNRNVTVRAGKLKLKKNTRWDIFKCNVIIVYGKFK